MRRICREPSHVSYIVPLAEIERRLEDFKAKLPEFLTERSKGLCGEPMASKKRSR